MNGPNAMTALLDQKQLAAYLGVSTSTLEHDRHNDRGVPYIKLGSTVRYRRSAVEAYLEANTITPGATP